MNEKRLAVHEVANLTGITIRTLHYYDEIGLLKPSIVTDAKYRLYTEADLCRLQEILFFREVGFALKEIKQLINSAAYNRREALKNHLHILQAQRERLDGLIDLIHKEIEGSDNFSFDMFSNSKILDLQAQFREEIIQRWGKTDSYNEFEALHSKSSLKKQQEQLENMLSTAQSFFESIAMYQHNPPECREVQNLVRQWQMYISEHFYYCDKKMLSYLGELYISDERFTAFINRFGQGNLAQYVSTAINIYCACADDCDT